MKNGDTVQLKIPEQGRRFRGKIIKIFDKDNTIRVMLSNGLYVEFPMERWELSEENERSDE